jgi:hypothetical protein
MRRLSSQYIIALLALTGAAYYVVSYFKKPTTGSYTSVTYAPRNILKNPERPKPTGPSKPEIIGEPDPSMPETVQIWKKLSLVDPRKDDVPAKVKALVGKKIQVAGFFILNEIEGDYLNEFLLTPVSGGCIHVPPPPANYIIHVNMAPGKKIKIRWNPIVVEGVLQLTENRKERGMYFYEMVAQKVTDFPGTN